MNKDYKVECKKDHRNWYLSMTHDGYQWTSINIKDPDYEVPLIIEALRKLTNQSSRRDEAEVKICPCCGYPSSKVGRNP